jgi:hypothetical protein
LHCAVAFAGLACAPTSGVNANVNATATHDSENRLFDDWMKFLRPDCRMMFLPRRLSGGCYRCAALGY